MSDKKKTELVTLYKNQLVTDSRKVAEHFGKRHDHVIRDIEELISQNPKLGSDYFYETSYTAGTGKHYKMYLMNHDGFSLLVMGFTGKTALEWKLKFLEAFNTMEKEIRKQQAVPKIAPNPHYRTRMIKTAVKDTADTATVIADVFGVKKPMAMTAAMQMVGKAYGVDMTPLRQFIPAEANPSFLTPTKIAAEIGILTNKGNPNPQRVNSLLKEIGFQESVGGHWHATEEGKKLSEAMPYTDKLLQLSGGAIYDDDGNTIVIHDAKIQRLLEIIEDNAGHPVLVFYQYKHELARLKKAIKGARELKTSDDLRAWNRGEIPVLLAHPASAGYGLNLQQGGHIIVWYSLTWSLEQYLQANARLCRQGQTETVIIHQLIAKGTVDEAVAAALDRKEAGQQAMLLAIRKTVEELQ